MKIPSTTIEEFKETLTVIDAMHDPWYRHYRGNSIGRVLHYLYVICGLRVAENARIGDGVVHLYGDQFATFDWSGGFPDLTFTHASYFQDIKEEMMERGNGPLSPALSPSEGERENLHGAPLPRVGPQDLRAGQPWADMTEPLRGSERPT